MYVRVRVRDCGCGTLSFHEFSIVPVSIYRVQPFSLANKRIIIFVLVLIFKQDVIIHDAHQRKFCILKKQPQSPTQGNHCVVIALWLHQPDRKGKELNNKLID
jgi:hypothetical protein